MTLIKEYHEITLEEPTLDLVDKIAIERNLNLESLRTPHLLTKEMQRDFYKEVICNRSVNSRFYDIRILGDESIGMGGFTPIQWENRCAEISLILFKHSVGKGDGEKAMLRLLDDGFDRLNLNMIYGECYACSKAIGFWRLMASKYHFYITELPYRKYFNGEYHSSLYFSIKKESWERLRGKR